MGHAICFVILISLIYLNLAFGLQNSIIFPGSTRSSISSKYDDKNSYTDQPPRRIVPTPESNFGEWGSETRSTANRIINYPFPKISNPISNQTPKLNPISSQTSNHNSNQNSNHNSNHNSNYDQNQNYKPNLQNPNEMKGSSRKNNLNSLSEKDEDSRINDKKELSAFDELPYDFSQTDKIHRVSDLLRFLGIEDKKDDDGLMVRKSNDDPTQVACHTEMRTIDLATELNKSNEEFKLFPQCVKAKRCAGCCGFNSGKVCTPIKKEKVNVYAAVIRVKRSCDDSSCSAEIDKDNLRKMFQIDSHEECACKCKINSEECNENQEYEESSCKCQCKDSETMRSNCEKKAQMKWSDKSCQCECKKVLACSTGLVFSHKTCACARKGQA